MMNNRIKDTFEIHLYVFICESKLNIMTKENNKTYAYSEKRHNSKKFAKIERRIRKKPR